MNHFVKKLLVVTSLVSAFAEISIAKVIQIDGLQSNYRFEEKSAVYRTEYRLETIDTTCTRQVVDGYNQECDWEGGETTCRTVGGGQSCGLTPSGQQCFDLPSHEECSTEPSRHVCRNVPQYRDEDYACTRTVKVPYQVKEYDVTHEVLINVARHPNLSSATAEVINFAVNGATLNMSSVSSSGRFLISAIPKTSEIVNSGALKKFQSVVEVKLIDKASALSIYKTPASELSGDIRGVQMSVGPILDPRLVRVELVLKQNKLFKDKTIIERALVDGEFTITNNLDTGLIQIDFAKLNVMDQIQGKKVTIEVKVQTQFDLNSVINREELPQELVISKKLNQRM